MSFQLIRCRAESSHPRHHGERCNGFVARVPLSARFRRLLEHSDLARAGTVVCPCARCKSLHEIELPMLAQASSGGLVA